jgi:hypothetical protein
VVQQEGPPCLAVLHEVIASVGPFGHES